jgi:hypothetical protein
MIQPSDLIPSSINASSWLNRSILNGLSMIYCFDVLFDTQVDPDNWAQWLASLRVTHVEFHSYMRSHEMAVTPGKTWNSYAGDPRLWTSHEVMLQKVKALHRCGIRAILYVASYAASPEFFVKYPKWAAHWLDGRPVFFPDSYPPYLVIQSLKKESNVEYKIGGSVYKNYRQYIINQIRLALREFGFDGVRIDYYAIPQDYISPSFSGISNMSEDLVDFMQELNGTMKLENPEALGLLIELPHVDGDRIRKELLQRGGVDAHWLELWPQHDQTGPKYEDIISEIQYTRELNPKKAVIASFYPQNPPFTEFPELPMGWPAPNIQYNYATTFAAGGSWGGQSVDGHGSFTQVLPFKFSYMDEGRIRIISIWNEFMLKFGPICCWGNDCFSFKSIDIESIKFLHRPYPLIRVLPYWRKNLKNNESDLVIIHLIQYGENTDWPLLAEEPKKLSGVSLEVKLNLPLANVQRVYGVEPGSDLENLQFERTRDGIMISIPELVYYKLLIINLSNESFMPLDLSPAPDINSQSPEPFDIGGNLLWGDVDEVVILDEEPLVACSPFSVKSSNLILGQSSLIDNDSFHGSKCLAIRDGEIKFIGTQDQALRFNLNNYPRISFACKVINDSKFMIGFEVIDMDSKELRKFTYGSNDLDVDKPVWIIPDEWHLFQRNLLEDIQAVEWGKKWHNVAVTALFLGSDCEARFDLIKFERSGKKMPLQIYSAQSKEGISAINLIDETTLNFVLEPAATQVGILIDFGSCQLIKLVEIISNLDQDLELEFSISNYPDISISSLHESIIHKNKANQNIYFVDQNNGRYIFILAHPRISKSIQCTMRFYTH